MSAYAESWLLFFSDFYDQLEILFTHAHTHTHKHRYTGKQKEISAKTLKLKNKIRGTEKKNKQKIIVSFFWNLLNACLSRRYVITHQGVIIFIKVFPVLFVFVLFLILNKITNKKINKDNTCDIFVSVNNINYICMNWTELNRTELQIKWWLC